LPLLFFLGGFQSWTPGGDREAFLPEKLKIGQLQRAPLLQNAKLEPDKGSPGLPLVCSPVAVKQPKDRSGAYGENQLDLQRG